MQLFLKRYRRIRGRLATLFLCQLFFLLVFFPGAIAFHLPNFLVHSDIRGDIHSNHDLSWHITSGAAIAQPTSIRRVDPIALSAQVYQQLPDLPLENQYISRETGDPAVENTLVSRLIRYHVYIKNRPTVFRLDWKLTLADYLGAFERISASSYPDNDLQESPYQNDIAAIESLSAAQRNSLVNTLYEVFTLSTSEANSSETDSSETDSSEMNSSETNSPQ